LMSVFYERWNTTEYIASVTQCTADFHPSKDAIPAFFACFGINYPLDFP